MPPEERPLDLTETLKQWIEEATGGSLLPRNPERLIGGPASPVHRLEVEIAGRPSSVVLRRFVCDNWLREEPDLAKHEATVLSHAHQHGLAVPEVLAFTQDRSLCGSPALLMSCLPGSVLLDPPNHEDWLQQLAFTLHSIHDLPIDGISWNYFSFTPEEKIQVPPWTSCPALWEEAVRIYRAGHPQCDPVFLHRDFHPANVLWQGPRLTGIVDWVNACVGPPNVDVSHCCINLATLQGIDSALAFRRTYQALAGDRFHYHPYWDLDSLFGWALPEPEFYKPWLGFGVKEIAQEELRQRQDDYLGAILEGL